MPYIPLPLWTDIWTRRYIWHSRGEQLLPYKLDKYLRTFTIWWKILRKLTCPNDIVTSHTILHKMDISYLLPNVPINIFYEICSLVIISTTCHALHRMNSYANMRYWGYRLFYLFFFYAIQSKESDISRLLSTHNRIKWKIRILSIS